MAAQALAAAAMMRVVHEWYVWAVRPNVPILQGPIYTYNTILL